MTTNILLLTDLEDVSVEPAYFHAFEMVHRVGALCQHLNADPPITFNVLESQKSRFGSRLPKAAKTLLYEWKVISATGKLSLDVVISVIQKPKDGGENSPLARRIEDLSHHLEGLGVLNLKAIVPRADKYEPRLEGNPIKAVKKWKIESPDQGNPYAGDFDIADRFERDGKVKHLGDIGLRFLFDYVDPNNSKNISPWATINLWPQI